MKVLITSPRGKQHLIEEFYKQGCDVVKQLDRDVKLIVPTVDEELWFFSYNRDWFKSHGITVACSPEFAVGTCRDKAEFSRFCKRHGYDTPHTGQFEAIIKPRFGKGSKGQIKVDRSYIFQEIVTWPEYSIDYYKDDSIESVIPRIRLDVVNGESTRAVIVEDERLINEAINVARTLGLEYHNVMQCFYDGHNIKWLEVNPRYGGGSWMTFDKFNSVAHLVKTLKEKVEK